MKQSWATVLVYESFCWILPAARSNRCLLDRVKKDVFDWILKRESPVECKFAWAWQIMARAEQGVKVTGIKLFPIRSM